VAPHVGTTWGRGGEFGMLPLASGWLCVFAEAAVDASMVRGAGSNKVSGTDGSGKAELEQRFGNLHQPIPEVVARIGSSPVLRVHRRPDSAHALIVRRSEQIARLATARNPVLRAFRNGMLRVRELMGPSAALRQADVVMNWEYPAGSAGRQGS